MPERLVRKFTFAQVLISQKRGSMADTNVLLKKRLPKSPKGVRARQNLIEAGLRVLERNGYHKLRIADVTDEAGVAFGLFYHYFEDTQSFVAQALAEFVETLVIETEAEAAAQHSDWYGRFFGHHHAMVKFYKKHPGLMRCILQVSDDQPEIAKIWRDTLRQRLDGFLDLLPRVFPDFSLDRTIGRLILFGLYGIAEEVLTEYYIRQNPALTENELSTEELAEWLTILFYRAIFGSNPPAERLRYVKDIDKMVYVPKG